MGSVSWTLHFPRWALVKDKETAKKMTEYIELNTIGVSKVSQLRVAKVLKAVSDSCGNETAKSFFEHSYDAMFERWKLLKQASKTSKGFTVPDFASQRCNFLGKVFEPQPGTLKEKQSKWLISN